MCLKGISKNMILEEYKRTEGMPLAQSMQMPKACLRQNSQSPQSIFEFLEMLYQTINVDRLGH